VVSRGRVIGVGSTQVFRLTADERNAVRAASRGRLVWWLIPGVLAVGWLLVLRLRVPWAELAVGAMATAWGLLLLMDAFGLARRTDLRPVVEMVQGFRVARGGKPSRIDVWFATPRNLGKLWVIVGLVAAIVGVLTL